MAKKNIKNAYLPFLMIEGGMAIFSRYSNNMLQISIDNTRPLLQVFNTNNESGFLDFEFATDASFPRFILRKGDISLENGEFHSYKETGINMTENDIIEHNSERGGGERITPFLVGEDYYTVLGREKGGWHEEKHQRDSHLTKIRLFRGLQHGSEYFGNFSSERGCNQRTIRTRPQLSTTRKATGSRVCNINPIKVLPDFYRFLQKDCSYSRNESRIQRMVVRLDPTRVTKRKEVVA